MLGNSCPETPFLDAALLLAHILNTSRTKLLASMTEELSYKNTCRFMALIKKRLEGYPIAYIFNEKEFYGLSFYVDPRVLVPRPETELLVEFALEALASFKCDKEKKPVCHDAFCGSGCVGLSIIKANPAIIMSLSDLSEDALEVSKINAEKLFGSCHNISISKGNILSVAPEGLALVTANPPYVATSFVEGMKAKGSKEPGLALDGGVTGLDLYPEIAKEAFNKLRHGGFLLLEIGEEQGSIVKSIFETTGFVDIKLHKDLAALDRLIVGKKP